MLWKWTTICWKFACSKTVWMMKTKTMLLLNPVYRNNDQLKIAIDLLDFFFTANYSCNSTIFALTELYRWHQIDSFVCLSTACTSVTQRATLEPDRRISVIANDNKLFVRDRLANRHVLCMLFSSELKRTKKKERKKKKDQILSHTCLQKDNEFKENKTAYKISSANTHTQHFKCCKWHIKSCNM